jgi:CRP-like cAMP-binding protein
MSGAYLVRKLNAYNRLSIKGEAAIEDLASRRLTSLPRAQDIISEGDDPRTVNIIVEGWACRYKTLEDGRRQILAFFVPGDLADLHVYILDAMDHSIGALTALRYSKVTPSEFEQLGDNYPAVLRALWCDSLVTAAIQREWLVSVGQRTALESIAHLICELFLRLKTVGLVEDGRCEFPLTQADIADALGMTQPHVSRTLKELRNTEIVRMGRGKLQVRNLAKLKSLAVFNPNYLHHLYEASRIEPSPS